MQSSELRKVFLDFFKARGHVIVSSSSLIPDDPSVLLTTAGMQQFKPYFTGKADPIKDFGSRRTASIQKAFRTSDIDEVGDETHLTFFEMLGHFSFGDYFKKETIEWTYELLTNVFKIQKDRIWASVFAGDDKIPFDEESYDAWLKFIPADKIKKGERKDNVWGPAGPEGPCGAANEVYVDNTEVATLVFMEYNCSKDGSLTPLPQKGVDVGWGFERLAMILQNRRNIFETDLLLPLISEAKILDAGKNLERLKRIVADHARAISFLVSDGVRPSNKDAGYILRRLMRRVMVYSKEFDDIFDKVAGPYGDFYKELNIGEIRKVFGEEQNKFSASLKRGLVELSKLETVDAVAAFKLYESLGLPYEVIKEFDNGKKTVNLTRESFEEEFRKHREISRRGQEKKFGGHGLILNTGELKAANEEEVKVVTRLHTATHLLQGALRKILGSEVKQMGSDITAERTRFDFSFPRKLTAEELRAVESLVNNVIAKDYSVIMEEMDYQDAIKSGALYFFKEKYPKRVSVYSVVADDGIVFSKEFCGGPHVSKTSEIGKFRIIKEEAVGAGVRRIKAKAE